MTRSDTRDGPALAAAFSTAVFKDLGAARVSRVTHERLQPVVRLGRAEGVNLGAAFDRAYELLERTYRNEHVFKTAIVSRVVFGRHSPRTSAALPELRMGSSWADVMVLNGTSTVYEVKTDLDQFTRLESQVLDYSSRCEFVNVVTSPERARTALSAAPDHVGVLALGRRGSLSVVRAARSNFDFMTSSALFTMLRTEEALAVLRDATGYVPDVPQGVLWKRARELFGNLSVEAAHAGVVKHMRTRSRAMLGTLTSATFPVSLRPLGFGVNLSAVAQARLSQRLGMSAESALSG